MNSIFVLLIAALGIGIGYLVYARRIDQNIVQPNPDKATPARMYIPMLPVRPTKNPGSANGRMPILPRINKVPKQNMSNPRIMPGIPTVSLTMIIHLFMCYF